MQEFLGWVRGGTVPAREVPRELFCHSSTAQEDLVSGSLSDNSYGRSSAGH